MTRSRRWRRACSITLRESARRGPCPCRTSGPKTPDSQAQYVGNVAGPDHGLHQAQCSKCFEWILYKSMWAQGNPNDATWMLGRLFCRIVPDCATLFRARYTPQISMHDNQHVVEEAFVCGVSLLSTWLKEGWFPEGLFAWPPRRQVPQEAASV